MSFLPPWSMPVGAIGKSAIHLTKVLEASGTPNVTLPTGIDPGDLIIVGAVGQSVNEDAPDMSNPSGFTVVHTLEGEAGGSRALRSRLYAKVATGSEDGTLLSILTDSSDMRVGHCIVLRPSQPIANLSVKATLADLTSGDPNANSMNPGAPFQLAFCLYSGYNTGGATDLSSRSFSPTEDGEILQNGTAGLSTMVTAFKYKLFVPDAAVGISVDLGDTGLSSSYIGAIIEVSQ